MNNSLFIRFCVVFSFVIFFLGLILLTLNEPHTTANIPTSIQKEIQSANLHPLSIVAMRKAEYPGSDFVIEEELANGSNFKRYVASYMSDGLKIYGLLTVPEGTPPDGGFPVVIFNHGYIPPAEYQTTERYVGYQNGFASSGYVTFKSDYRGHGISEGSPEGAYFSPAYTSDVLNALSSVKKLPYVNKNKIGMWGHSLGGNITQRAIVVRPDDIHAAVIWGGVVGSYEDLFRDWWSRRRPASFTPARNEVNANRPSRQLFTQLYGEPDKNNPFWDTISPTTFLTDVKAPVQLHHGLSDATVPDVLSKNYYEDLQEAGKTVEVYYYEGNDHNLSQSFNLAMERSIDFFDKYLK